MILNGVRHIADKNVYMFIGLICISYLKKRDIFESKNMHHTCLY